MTPAAKPGGTIQLAVVGQPRHALASFADLSGGPRVLMGEEIFLGLGGTLTLVEAGTLGLGGLHLRTIKLPGAGLPVGQVVYLQAVVLDSNAPNGAFHASNGESTVVYGARQVLVEEFTDPVAQGFTGNYDKSRRDRLLGAAVRLREHTINPKQGIVFPLPVQGPFNPYGARVQMVYRTSDLGSTGEREVLTAIRWLPKGGVPTVTYKRLVVDVGHSTVVPDFTVDPRSAFPKFPKSGLVTTYANNQKQGETPMRILDGGYTVRPQDVRKDGYISFPSPGATFTYNGINSLLLDFKMEPTPNLANAHGQQIQLMVLSSAQPNARVYAHGTVGTPVNPHTVAQGKGDNSLSYMQFEFARIESQATSPWRKAPVTSPKYRTPSLAMSLPAGTRIQVEYQGANTASGSGATGWWTNFNIADGKPFIQYRITMFANPWTGAVPSLESLVIPIN